ncbi:MAG: hypothetical protein JST84_04565 [Acidobacteria bacterium]|nr:hypothetical protein [Acidobacteriota bacterium]
MCPTAKDNVDGIPSSMLEPRQWKYPDSARGLLSRREWLMASLAIPSCAASVCQPQSVERAVTSAVIPSVHYLGADTTARVRAAEMYLETEMDRWSSGTLIYDDKDSGGAGFYPSNRMGDLEDIRLEDSSIESPVSGTTCLKITFSPQGSKGWTGVYWTYPDRQNGNWGEEKGRPLIGATKLQGWIRGAQGGEIVELTVGGMNRPPYNDPAKPYQDSFAVPNVRMSLTKEWERFEIPLPVTANLDSIIGGLACIFSRAYNPTGCTIYLDEISYDNADPQGLRLIRSYTPTVDASNQAFRNAAYLYDNALALLAFLSRGDAEGQRRARILADSLVWAQLHDRAYSDGRWRNAYACGSLEDPATATARLPGWYVTNENQPNKGKWYEDQYAVSSDVGNAAWAVLSLLAAHTILERGKKDSSYLRAARRAGEWVDANCRAKDDEGGYRGGFDGWEKTATKPEGPKPIGWRSSEHNIDLYVCFLQLYLASGESVWRERAIRARDFVLSMWNPSGHFFYTGRDPQGAINKEAYPLDVQVWAVLAMGHDLVFRQKIVGSSRPLTTAFLREWVEKQCRLEKNNQACPSAKGYKFSVQGTGVWFEGTAQTAATYQYLSDPETSGKILAEIASANPVGKPDESRVLGAGVPISVGGIQAACGEPAWTGFYKEFEPGKPEKWIYPPQPHLGATAWFILASRKVNPYWLAYSPI